MSEIFFLILFIESQIMILEDTCIILRWQQTIFVLIDMAA